MTELSLGENGDEEEVMVLPVVFVAVCARTRVLSDVFHRLGDLLSVSVSSEQLSTSRV
jgi:hypothetical protein